MSLIHLLYPSNFFPLAFVLVNDLFLVSRCFLFWKCRTILFSFLLPFVSSCCMHLYFMFTAVSYHMLFHWCSFMYPHWGFWNKPLDLVLNCAVIFSNASTLIRNAPTQRRTRPQSSQNDDGHDVAEGAEEQDDGGTDRSEPASVHPVLPKGDDLKDCPSICGGVSDRRGQIHGRDGGVAGGGEEVICVHLAAEWRSPRTSDEITPKLASTSGSLDLERHLTVT